MTKSELVDAIADGAGLTKADSERALKACTGAIEGALKKRGRSISYWFWYIFSCATCSTYRKKPKGTW